MNKATAITIIAVAFIIGLTITEVYGSQSKIEAYNNGYREGMLYAYDNVVVCGASPEEEGLRLSKIMGKSTVSSISCEE